MNVMKTKAKKTEDGEDNVDEEVKSIEKLILLERWERYRKNICIVILKSIL